MCANKRDSHCRLILLVFLLALPSFVSSQITFQKTYESSANSQAFDLVQTSDSGFVITGFVGSMGLGGKDVFLLKTDKYGTHEWMKVFGGASAEQGQQVIITSDNGLLVAGYTASFGAGFDDVYVYKTDSLGNYIWGKTIGGSSTDRAYGISEEFNGAVFVAGSSYSFGAGSSDVLVSKIDIQGNILWTKTYGGANFEEAYSVLSTEDGGAIVVGSTRSFGAGIEDFYILKLDSIGNVKWSKTIGGSDWDQGRSVCQTSDGGFAICGFTQSFSNQKHYDLKCYVAKLDSNGIVLWSTAFGVFESENIPFSISETDDKGFAIAGYSGDFIGDYRGYLVKLDGVGDFLWSRGLGSGYLNTINSVIPANDIGLAMVGYSNGFGNGSSDIYMIKSDEYGISECFDSLNVTLIKDTLPVITTPQDSITLISVDDTALTIVYDTVLNVKSICDDFCNVEASMIYELKPFSPSSHIVCLGSTLSLTNNSFGATTIRWEVNGDYLGNFNDTVITLDSLGTFDFVLYADSSICTDSGSLTVTVTESALANFGYSISDLVVDFVDSSFFASAYYWDFGDGSTDTIQTPEHTYADTGMYLVCLVVLNSCDTDSICKIVHIECRMPVADFSYVDTGLTVEFQSMGQFGDTYSWVYGDGGSAIGENPTYVYTQPGTYEVCFVVLNDCGADVSCQFITVDSLDTDTTPVPLSNDIVNSDLYFEYFEDGKAIFRIPNIKSSNVIVEVYNMLGQLQPITLMSIEKDSRYELIFNLQPALYILVVKTDRKTFVKNIVLD